MAILAMASLALAAVPPANAAEPDNATLLQEIKGLKELVQDLAQTVRSLDRRVTVLEGRAQSATSVAPAKPPSAQAPPRAAPAAPSQPAPAVLPQAAPAAPQAAPAEPAQARAAVPQAAAIGATTGYASPEAALRASWSSIEAGMEEREVTRLLGPPSKKLTLDGRTVWYYYYPATGSGSIFFTDAGRVTSRKSPFGWWDW